MAISKVEFGGKTLMDLTEDSVSEENLLQGETAHNAKGEKVVGGVTVPGKISQLENDVSFRPVKHVTLAEYQRIPDEEKDSDNVVYMVLPGRIFSNGKEYGASAADVSQSIVGFQSDDTLEPESPIDVPIIEEKETVGGFAAKISRVARNVRYLLKMLGTTDISAIGNGTLTGTIKALSDDKADKNGIVLTGDATGTSVVDEETGRAMISAKRKSCIAYAGGSNGGWFNIAYLKVPIYYQDYSITFLVEKTYGNDNFFAILRMMSRVVPNGVSSASLTLECTNITDPTIFVLTHNIDSDNQIEYRIWVRNTTMYQGVAFTVLSEATGSQLTTGLFTLYSPYASEALSEIPPEYTQVPATLATIQNPVEKALSANAVDGIYRYDSNSNDGVTVLPRYGKRAFCVLSYFGNNGANGFPPITFILETPYNFSENNPKVSYISRDSENTTIEITKNENDRYIIRALKDGNYTRYFSLLLITIN